MRQRTRDPLLTVLNLVVAALMFVIAPLRAAGVVEANVFAFGFEFMLVVAIFMVSDSLFAVAGIVLAMAMSITANLLEQRQQSIFDLWLYAAAWLIAGVTVNVVVARAVFAPGVVTYHRIVGAMLLYLNIGVIFVALYSFVILSAPRAFTNLPPPQHDLALAADVIYFSFVTLTSVGYGDIVPLHPLARGLANLEAVFGQLYPAIFLTRLLTLRIEQKPET
ncbi:MAG TPA: ion channel [Rhizomicrobium sp.]|nr:ion channel [Rhizomicrobium sp.]